VSDLPDTRAPSSPVEPVRLRLDIAYDGTAFFGWARQPELRTVQGVLEDALCTLFPRSVPRLTVAGRTDAGVHATGQVAHVDVRSDELAVAGKLRAGVVGESDSDDRLRGFRSTRAGVQEGLGDVLQRRLTGILGWDTDVAVTRVSRAPVGFDARFSALWRRYEYRLIEASGVANPLDRHRCVTVSRALDLSAMDAAAQALIGMRDFAAFCKPREGATTIRTLQAFSWHRELGGVFLARLQADAFCHSMVRALIGACVAVGGGKLSVTELLELQRAAERTGTFPVMAAKGLVLTEVGYPVDAELAARTVQTRAKRELPCR